MDKGDLIFLGVASAIGALIGLGLSVTAFSPLAIGGIVAAVPAILFAACIICDNVQKGAFPKKDLFNMAVLCVASATIGVGLAAAATAIFPGVMLGAGSAALTGATIGAIGAIAPIAGLFVAEIVDSCIISPIVEHFSSKGKGCESL
ncbi:hypothetical protein [Wolbachia endosymbiont of Oedothorax gibbosus]|uniref:hypothetical protein n=1 Tax=Wolbachia endosymbiont of Oedothorax gibbosus TaxID=931100 RepID=UPI002024B936|nr:hypothetical protein [Wolbachia endosymbiont of Oedothorax gibbosus]